MRIRLPEPIALSRSLDRLRNVARHLSKGIKKSTQESVFQGNRALTYSFL